MSQTTKADPRHKQDFNLSEAIAVLDEVSAQIAPDPSALEDWHRNYFRSHRERLALDLVLCVRHATSANQPILEIGCIPPFLTAALASMGRQAVGVDIAPERYSAAISRLGLQIIRCDIEREPLSAAVKERFQLVLLNEVFEHLRIDLNFTFQQISAVIAPGGLLMMSTPNLFSFRGIRNFLCHRRAYAIDAKPYEEFAKLKNLGHMGHIREYTPAEITEFLRALRISRSTSDLSRQG